LGPRGHFVLKNDSTLLCDIEDVPAISKSQAPNNEDHCRRGLMISSLGAEFLINRKGKRRRKKRKKRKEKGRRREQLHYIRNTTAVVYFF